MLRFSAVKAVCCAHSVKLCNLQDALRNLSFAKVRITVNLELGLGLGEV